MKQPTQQTHVSPFTESLSACSQNLDAPCLAIPKHATPKAALPSQTPCDPPSPYVALPYHTKAHLTMPNQTPP